MSLLLLSNSKTKNVPIIDCEGNAIQHAAAVNCYDDGGVGSWSCSIENHEYARSHYQSHRLMLFVVVAVLLLTATTDEWNGRD